jgi:hypothetical protein
MISEENIRICKEYEKKLSQIYTHIYNFDNGSEPLQCDNIILLLLKKHGLVTAIHSYPEAKHTFKPTGFEKSDFTSLLLPDFIKGYYDIISIKNKLRSLRIETETLFTDEYWYNNLFKVIHSDLNFESFLESMARLHGEIYTFLKSIGLQLPAAHFLKKDLIALYLETRDEKKIFLPPIKQLLVNDTLYIVNYVHGGLNIKNDQGRIIENTIQTVDIPETMNFYRLMASEYGSLACTSPIEVNRYLNDINRFLSIKRKNTHRNNIKTVENIISKGLKKTKAYMTIRRMTRTMIATEKQKNRYHTSRPHVHFFKKSKMIFKYHSVYLYRNDQIDSIYVANPQMNINLLDYLDVKIENGVIRFNSFDIIKLIEFVKYVLFIDLSCSSSMNEVTNDETNHFKSLAKKIEGHSITEKMGIHVNASPYNESPETKHLSLTKKSKSRSKRPRSINRSLNKLDKLRRYKLLTS